MPHSLFILAEGGLGAIVPIVIFALLWVFGQVAGWLEAKKKREDAERNAGLPPELRGEGEGEQVILIDPQTGEMSTQRAPEPSPSQRKKNRKPANRGRPALRTQEPPQRSAPRPAMTESPEMEVQTMRSAAAMRNPEPMEREVSTVRLGTAVRRVAQTTASKEVAEMLKPGSIRQAFLISEILGKPVAMKDEQRE